MPTLFPSGLFQTPRCHPEIQSPGSQGLQWGGRGRRGRRSQGSGDQMGSGLSYSLPHAPPRTSLPSPPESSLEATFCPKYQGQTPYETFQVPGPALAGGCGQPWAGDGRELLRACLSLPGYALNNRHWPPISCQARLCHPQLQASYVRPSAGCGGALGSYITCLRHGCCLT